VVVHEVLIMQTCDVPTAGVTRAVDIRSRGWATWVACLGSLLALHATASRSVHAACNLIPVAERTYPSTLGAITSPITAPGKNVTLTITPCDSSQGFDPIVGNNVIALAFQPPGPGVDTVVSISGANNPSVTECTLPSGRCRKLTFEMPDTSLVLPPEGLAGPAQITVRDVVTDAVVATIDRLYLPTLGCDRQPETVFEQFTVLPHPNSYLDAASNGVAQLRATVDGSGSLLVPFDYWGGGAKSVLAETPGAPVAIFLEGTAEIPAMGASDPITIQHKLAAQSSPSSFVRSFTLNGRPLPPLLRVTSSGGLFGTADAVESALRIARNDGKGGPSLFDLSDRLSADGRGPIMIDTFNLAVNSPVPLQGLQATDGAIAYARDEAREANNLNFRADAQDLDPFDLVVQVVNQAQGSAVNTQAAVARPQYALAPLAVVAGDGVVAFLEAEADQGFNDLDGDGNLRGNLLRVFDNQGTDRTGALSIDAAVSPLVDGRSIAVSGSKVFVRRNAEVASVTVDYLTDADGAERLAISPDGRHIYAWTSSGQWSLAVFAREATDGSLALVEILTEADLSGALAGYMPTNALAVSPDGAHVYLGLDGQTCACAAIPCAPGECLDAIVTLDRDALSGALTYTGEEYFDAGGLLSFDGHVVQVATGMFVSADGAHLYASLSFPNAIAVFERNVFDGSLSYLEAAKNGDGGVTGLARPSGVAGSADGAHVYGISFTDSAVTVFARSGVTGSLSFLEAHFDGLGGVDHSAGATDVLVSPDGAHVYVGAATTAGVSTFARDASTGRLGFVGANVDGFTGFAATPWGGIHLAASPDGSRIYASSRSPFSPFTTGAVTAFDRNPVSGRLEVGSTTYDRLVGGLSYTSLGVSAPYYPSSIVVAPDGADVYVGSVVDMITQLRPYHALGVFDLGSTTFLEPSPAAHRVAVAEGRAAILTPEAYAGIDLNGDSDAASGGDLVAQLYDATRATPVVTNLKVAASRVAISTDLVAMTVREANENQTSAAGTDRNGDGDTADDVLAVYTIGGSAPPGNVGAAADAIAAIGPHVVFVTPEADEGPAGIGCGPTDVYPGGCDLNGDGDAADRVIRAYDRRSSTITEIGMAVEEFVTGGQYVAFRSSELKQNQTDLNGDGGIVLEDMVMHVYDLEANELINTGFTAIPCELPGCDPLAPYKIRGDTLSFLSWEVFEGNDTGVDRNGDGDANDIVLVVYNMISRRAQIVGTVVNDGVWPDPSAPAPFPADEIGGGTVVFVMARESDVGEDINGDGIIDDSLVVLLAGDADEDGTFDDFDTCLYAANPNQVDFDVDELGDLACDEDIIACPVEPLSGCRTPVESKRSKLSVRDASDDTKDAITWKWSRGAATSIEDFRDPINGGAAYAVCLYDASNNEQALVGSLVSPAATCGDKGCWKATKKGYKFTDKTAAQTGVVGINLVSGESGKAKFVVKGRGPGLGLRNLPVTSPVRVQMFVNDGSPLQCWEATFSAFTKNQLDQLKAKSD
jgi:6-phosphogluconolactonase (cycloisomerase 2 family)